jgi:hypothetical protein
VAAREVGSLAEQAKQTISKQEEISLKRTQTLQLIAQLNGAINQISLFLEKLQNFNINPVKWGISVGVDPGFARNV